MSKTKVYYTDSGCIITAKKNNMQATIQFDKYRLPDRNTILKELSSKGITHGIVYGAIADLESTKNLKKEYIVAEGKHPQNGTNGSIKYTFDTEYRSKPHVDEEGNIDFKHLYVFHYVKEGDIIAIINKPTEGVDGYDVFGKKLKAKRGKEVLVNFNPKHIIKDENNKLIAQIDGSVRVKENKIAIEDIFTLESDVGPDSGNIDYHGTVIVKGNVLPGYQINATGNIEVFGFVESGVLSSKGDIFIHKGISGRRETKVTTEGGLKTKYIQNANVISCEDVITESILYSDISSKKAIIAVGKHGVINGGTYKASTMIKAKQIGSNMSTRTILEVGLSDELEDAYEATKENIAETKKQISKYTNLMELLLLKKDKLNLDKKQLLKEAKISKNSYQMELDALEQKIEKIEQRVKDSKNAFVEVAGEVFHGVSIKLNEAVYHVDETITAARFYKARDEVLISRL